MPLEIRFSAPKLNGEFIHLQSVFLYLLIMDALDRFQIQADLRKSGFLRLIPTANTFLEEFNIFFSYKSSDTVASFKH